MITVDKAKGFCKMSGTGLELAMDITNIVASFCETVVEQRKPGVPKHEAMETAEAYLRTALKVGIDVALSGEESIPGGEDSNSAE